MDHNVNTGAENYARRQFKNVTFPKTGGKAKVHYTKKHVFIHRDDVVLAWGYRKKLNKELFFKLLDVLTREWPRNTYNRTTFDFFNWYVRTGPEEEFKHVEPTIQFDRKRASRDKRRTRK